MNFLKVFTHLKNVRNVTNFECEFIRIFWKNEMYLEKLTNLFNTKINIPFIYL